MPFDPLAPPPRPPLRRPELRPVAVWLFRLCGMVLVMVTLGGATRLTGSGLSIMEWAPLMGALPPLSDAEWHRLYALYQQIPQYELVNQGFGLDGFKPIFWLEWAASAVGPADGRGAPRCRSSGSRCAAGSDAGSAGAWPGCCLLGGLQGAVGWFMVASGFEADRTAVSPYRLVMHLALALALYAALLWTALGVWRQAAGPHAGTSSRSVRRLTVATCVAVATTIIAGGFVSGLHAGLVYNSFPFMDGRLVPAEYSMLRPFHLNLFENVAAVQFDHRVLATLTALLAASCVLVGLRQSSGPIRSAVLALGAAVAVQYALGVTTLLWVVPVPLATAHQATAMLVLTAALTALHLQGGIRRAPAHP